MRLRILFAGLLVSVLLGCDGATPEPQPEPESGSVAAPEAAPLVF